MAKRKRTVEVLELNPDPTVELSARTLLAISRETDFGSATVAYKLLNLPLEPPSLTEPYARFWDNSLRNITTLDFGGIPTTRRTEGSLAGPFYIDICPPLLLGILGKVQTSATNTSPLVATTLTASESRLSTVLDVASVTGFTVGDIIRIGPQGGETTETAKITAIDDIALTITIEAPGLVYDHSSGEDVVQSKAPYTYVFSLKTDGLPPSHTFNYKEPFEDWIYYGIRVTSMTLRFSAAEGVLNFSCDWVGQRKTATTWTPAALTEPEKPLPGWSAYLVMGGAEVKLIDYEVVLTRDADVRYNIPGTIADAKDYPTEILLSPLAVTGTITCLFDSTAEAKYRDGTQESLKVKLVKPGTTEGTDSERSIAIEIPIVDYGEGAFEVDRTGTTLVSTLRFRGLWDLASAKGIEVTILNEKYGAY